MITLDQAGAAADVAKVEPAPVELRGRVECTSVERPAASEAYRGREWRIVPDHCPHLLYHRLRDGSRLTLVGPRTRAVDVPKDRRRLTVAVRLRSWTLPGLLDVAPSELRDRSIPLAQALGRPGARLQERLDELRADECVPALTDWLRRRATGPEARSEARARQASAALQQTSSCREAARELQVSPRGLRLIMGSGVGLAPKTYARIVRLHRALDLAAGGGPWTSTAFASGYYDQAHMIREFRHFLGESPQEWARRRSGGPRA